jgi:hypothetical protein
VLVIENALLGAARDPPAALVVIERRHHIWERELEAGGRSACHCPQLKQWYPMTSSSG